MVSTNSTPPRSHVEDLLTELAEKIGERYMDELAFIAKLVLALSAANVGLIILFIALYSRGWV